MATVQCLANVSLNEMPAKEAAQTCAEDRASLPIRARDYPPRSVGSSASLNQSPVRLTTSDVSISTTPGKTEIHHALSR